MATILQQFVNELSDDEKRSIINSFEVFEKDGYIGDEPVRTYTMTFMRQHNIPVERVVMWMSDLAGECYRYFAHKYFEQNQQPPTYHW